MSALASPHRNRVCTPYVWNAEKIECLQQLIAVGASYTEIAAQLGTTRNSVAGAAHRNGLSKPARTEAAERRIKSQLSAAPPAASIIRTPVRPLSPEYAESIIKRDPAKLIPLLKLRAHHCRCVISLAGEQSLYCGEPVVEGGSWCAEHKAAFVVAPRRRY